MKNSDILDASDVFAHAYLIYGGSAEGRSEAICEYMAKIIMLAAPDTDRELLLTRLNDKSYADVYTVYKENKSVTIDSVRGIVPFFALEPVEAAQLKFAVINDSETMQDSAQNALLKVIEEPPENRYIFLSAANTDTVLPTILSRVQKIKLSDGLSDEAPDESDIIDTYERICRILLEGDIETLFDTVATAEKNKEDPSYMLDNMLSVFHELLLIKNAASTSFGRRFSQLAEHISTGCILRITDLINASFTALAANVTVKLTVENLLITILEEYNAENSRDTI